MLGCQTTRAQYIGIEQNELQIFLNRVKIAFLGGGGRFWKIFNVKVGQVILHFKGIIVFTEFIVEKKF